MKDMSYWTYFSSFINAIDIYDIKLTVRARMSNILTNTQDGK